MSIDEVPFPAARTLAAPVAGLGAPEGALEAGAGDAGAAETAAGSGSGSLMEVDSPRSIASTSGSCSGVTRT